MKYTYFFYKQPVYKPLMLDQYKVKHEKKKKITVMLDAVQRWGYSTHQLRKVEKASICTSLRV